MGGVIGSKRDGPLYLARSACLSPHIRFVVTVTKQQVVDLYMIFLSNSFNALFGSNFRPSGLCDWMEVRCLVRGENGYP